MRGMAIACAALAAAILLGTSAARAAEEGADDLNKALELKVGAKTMSDLGKVIDLCESALKKGLDADNQQFAKKVLAAALVQRGSVVAQSILGGGSGRQWDDFRKTALADLEKAVALDPTQGEAYQHIAEMQMLPGGDRKKALAALDKAVELSKDEPGTRAKALAMRASVQQDPKKKLDDLNEAAKISPDNAIVLRQRAMVQLEQKKFKETLADLDALLKLQPESKALYELKSTVLMWMKDYKQAFTVIDQWRKVDTSVSPLLQRARICIAMSDTAAALKELEAVSTAEPKNLEAMRLRAAIYHEQKKDDKALEEIDRLLALRPGMELAVFLKASILVSMGRSAEAASMIEKVILLQPGDVDARLQLALIYEMDHRHRKAIAVYDAILAKKPDTFSALRGRGDAHLGTGDHAAAIADYEKAYKVRPDDSGLLNNFAWVLCTSPDDKLRNGRRALELAQQACKVTDYSQGHILSTLGAAYAEVGDFDNAKKWSQKAIDAGRDDQKDDLRKELESYKAGKPIRERKDEDKDSPVPAKTKPDAKAKPIGQAQPEKAATPETKSKAEPKPSAVKPKAEPKPKTGGLRPIDPNAAEPAPEPPKPEPAGK